MKFHLVDRIERIERTRPADGPASGRIVTIKALSLAEEYLADHFPAFPVMPGVLMVEAMVQAGAWLARVCQDFSRSVVVLQRARNVRYASFVQPGQVLRCDVTATAIGPDAAELRSAGFVGDRQVVSGRLDLRCFNLAGRAGASRGTDEAIVADLRGRFALIGGVEALARADLDAAGG